MEGMEGEGQERLCGRSRGHRTARHVWSKRRESVTRALCCLLAGERAGPEQAPPGAEDNPEASAGAEVTPCMSGRAPGLRSPLLLPPPLGLRLPPAIAACHGREWSRPGGERWGGGRGEAGRERRGVARSRGLGFGPCCWGTLSLLPVSVEYPQVATSPETSLKSKFNICQDTLSSLK